MPSKLRSGLGTKISFFAFQDIITSVTGILILVTLILSLYVDESAPVDSEQARLKQQLAATISELARVNLENELRQPNLRIPASPAAPEQLQSQIRELELQVAANSNRLASLTQANQAQYLQSSNRAEVLISDLKRHVTRAEQELDSLRQTNAVLVAQIKAVQKDLEKKRAATGAGDNPWFVIPEPNPDGKQPVLLTISATNLTCERFNQPAAKQSLPAAGIASGFAQNLARWRPGGDYLVFYVRPSGIDLFLKCLQAAKAAGFQAGYDAVEEDQNLVFSHPVPP